MNKKVLLAIAVLGLFLFAHLSGVTDYLSLKAIQSQLDSLQSIVQSNPIASFAISFFVYVLATSLSLPGAALLTLLAGALFGLGWGTVLVSFASSLGATLAMLLARFFLREWVERKFSKTLNKINKGLKDSGDLYLLTLRLVPLFPFFAINLSFGPTQFSSLRFYIISQIGMLPGTIIYVNAGKELAQLESLNGLFSPSLWLAFILLALLPWIGKLIQGFVQNRKVYSSWKGHYPSKFEANMVVIGAGSGGLVSSYIAAVTKAKVILIEKEKMGGDCLNTGCVPSKALLKSAKIVSLRKSAHEFGINQISVDFDFSKIMERVQKVIQEIEPHDSRERYEGLGVECLKGTATILSPWEVKVGDRVITTKNIVIATGARPRIPQIKGIDQIKTVTSDTLWGIRTLPASLIIVGGGPIGVEMAQAFIRLGSKVTLLEKNPRILMKEDEDIAKYVQDKLSKEGVEFFFGVDILECIHGNPMDQMVIKNHGEIQSLPSDLVLLALGRVPTTHGFGFETLKIPLSPSGLIPVNDYQQTIYPNIFAVGDVVGPYQLTHMAAHQAWYAAVNGLFGFWKKFKVDYSVVPWCTFTDPEVATVGLSAQAAQSAGLDFEITDYDLSDLDRAIAEGEAYGKVRVITEKGKDKILGATIVGPHASDLILEFVSAMKFKKGLNAILGTIHLYPSLGEANKYAAGEWKRNHVNPGHLQKLSTYHQGIRHGRHPFFSLISSLFRA